MRKVQRELEGKKMQCIQENKNVCPAKAIKIMSSEENLLMKNNDKDVVVVGWRKIFRSIGIFFLWYLGISSFAYGDPKPKISVENASKYIGEISEGKSVEVVFTIKNEGDAELIILKTVPLCSCTTSFADNTKIVPGTSEQLKVTFDSKGFSGKQELPVRVVTNDLSNQILNVTIYVNVIPKVLLSRNFLDFNRVFQSVATEPLATQFRVHASQAYDSVTLSSPASSFQLSPFFLESGGIKSNTTLTIDLKNNQTGEPVREGMFRVVLNSDSIPLGNFRETLKLEFSRRNISENDVSEHNDAKSTTDQSALPQIKDIYYLPIVAYVLPTLQLEKKDLSFVVKDAAYDEEKIVKVKNMFNEPLEFQEIKFALPDSGDFQEIPFLSSSVQQNILSESGVTQIGIKLNSSKFIDFLKAHKDTFLKKTRLKFTATIFYKSRLNNKRLSAAPLRIIVRFPNLYFK
jgi:hypothetical protein